MQKPEWIRDIKAIGWDLDGTLYPADAISWRVVRDKQIETLMHIRGWDRALATQQFEETISRLGSSTETMIALGADGREFFHALWDELSLEKYIHHDDAIVAMFQRLSGYRHFLVSNSNLNRHIASKLSLIGLSVDMFEVCLSTDELGVSKPNPKPFEEVLRRMHLLPSECLYVGDRVETDIVGAARVGMHTCLVGKESPQADVCLATTPMVADVCL